MLRIFQVFNFVGNWIIFYKLLGILYFYGAPVDNVFISLLGFLFVFILSLSTTLFTFHYAKKIYTKND